MSRNGADISSDGGLVLLPGETVIYSVGGVRLQASEVCSKAVDGTVYVSHHRVVFKAHKPKDLITFVMPLMCLHDLDLKQPMFGANVFTGKCDALPDGGYEGTSDFKLTFTEGGAIEFAQAVKKAYAHRQPLPASGPAMPAGIPLSAGFAPPSYTPAPYSMGPAPGSYPPPQSGPYPPQQPGTYPPPQPGSYPPPQVGSYPPPQPGAYPPPQAGAYPPPQPAAYPPPQSSPYPPGPGYGYPAPPPSYGQAYDPLGSYPPPPPGEQPPTYADADRLRQAPADAKAQEAMRS
eukprot:comp20990_c0_seq1/m.28134 comp20990_c0_seq1/g.28134  ORF comp20990_c0_seq1/g.28134 comp20990_c0_seq1/m.28134 type:complete len:290 (-) comp20990_c0_seq1:75-944(-)